MNRSQLVEEIATTTGLTKRQAEEAVDAFVVTIGDQVRSGSKVTIYGFGSFNPTSRKARTGRNPRTGQPVKIAASKGIRFSPATGFKADLNAKKSAAKKAAAAKASPGRAAGRVAPAKAVKATKAATTTAATAAKGDWARSLWPRRRARRHVDLAGPPKPASRPPQPRRRRRRRLRQQRHRPRRPRPRRPRRPRFRRPARCPQSRHGQPKSRERN